MSFGFRLRDKNKKVLLSEDVKPLTFFGKKTLSALNAVSTGRGYDRYIKTVNTNVPQSVDPPIVYYVPSTSGDFGITELYASNGFWNVTVIGSAPIVGIELYIFAKRDVLYGGKGLRLKDRVTEEVYYNSNDRFLWIKSIDLFTRGVDVKFGNPLNYRSYYGITYGLDSIWGVFSSKIAINVPVFYNGIISTGPTGTSVADGFGAVSKSSTQLSLTNTVIATFNMPSKYRGITIINKSLWDNFTVSVIDASLYD